MKKILEINRKKRKENKGEKRKAWRRKIWERIEGKKRCKSGKELKEREREMS